MPLDDGYVPQPKHLIPITEPRVMRLEDVHESQRSAIQRAILRLRPDLTHDVVDAQVIDAEAYCYDRAALVDFRRMAQISADVRGVSTYLHIHAFDTECQGQEHEQFEPNSRRSVAVGGPTHL